jgi:hypothetical protein
MIVDCGLRLPANNATKWRKSYAHGGQGRQSYLPLLSPSAGDLDLGVVHPPPLHHPLSGALGTFSLSLSLSLSLFEPTFSHRRHVSPPAWPHPQVGWHPAVHYDRP